MRNTYDDCCLSCKHFEDGERIYHNMSPCAECIHSNIPNQKWDLYNYEIENVRVLVLDDDYVEAKCPYCGYNNIMADEDDLCDHFYYTDIDGEYLIFYFTY